MIPRPAHRLSFSTVSRAAAGILAALALAACPPGSGSGNGGGPTNPPDFTPSITILAPSTSMGCTAGEGCKCDFESKNVSENFRIHFVVDDTLGTHSRIFCGRVPRFFSLGSILGWDGSKSPVFLEEGMHTLRAEARDVFTGEVIAADTQQFPVTPAP